MPSACPNIKDYENTLKTEINNYKKELKIIQSHFLEVGIVNMFYYLITENFCFIILKERISVLHFVTVPILAIYSFTYVFM